MTQHTELIERLRKGQTHDPASGELRDMSSVMDDGADALEAQAREIAGLRAELDRANKVAALIHEGLKTIPQDEPTPHGTQP